MTPQYRPGPLWRLVDKLLDVIEAYAYRAAGVQVTRRHAGATSGGSNTTEQDRTRDDRERHEYMKKLITLAEAAERVAVSERTVRRAISRGLLPAVTVAGRSLRIDPDDLGKMLRPVPSAD